MKFTFIFSLFLLTATSTWGSEWDGRRARMLVDQLQSTASSLRWDIQSEISRNPGRDPFEQSRRRQALSGAQSLSSSAGFLSMALSNNSEDPDYSRSNFRQVQNDVRRLDFDISGGNFEFSVRSSFSRVQWAVRDLEDLYR